MANLSSTTSGQRQKRQNRPIFVGGRMLNLIMFIRPPSSSSNWQWFFKLGTNCYGQRYVLTVIGRPVFDCHQGSSRDVTFHLRVFTYDKVHHLLVVPIHL